ncbi:hypothetical protein OG618_02185 [Kitasatospora sp. NBC_01246]|uniref:hypothetical protein n=1 Tax=Kitasatospora sp. NBC_01246 TaxID=2903570 RepID=UPI002E2EA9F9|nr:hypothetical protein [Kitasatospora sp. NBC_01246]
MTNIDRRHALRVASAAAVGMGATLGATGTARASRRASTLNLKGRRAAADIPGVLTAGAPYFVHYELRDTDDNPVGTESAHSLPITVGPTGSLVLATVALRLTDGMLTAAGAFERPLPAVTEVALGYQPWSHTFAITGGTGDYTGASGALRIDHLSRDDSALTVTLA